MCGTERAGALQGLDVNASIDGRPPLHHAADYGQVDVLEYLIEKGADVNVRPLYSSPFDPGAQNAPPTGVSPLRRHRSSGGRRWFCCRLLSA